MKPSELELYDQTVRRYILISLVIANVTKHVFCLISVLAYKTTIMNQARV